MPTIQPRMCVLAGLVVLALLIPPGCGPGGGSGSGYKVTTSVDGLGNITLDPAGGPYAYGDAVKLTAVPTAGWKFDKWEGGTTGTTNPTQITVTTNVSVKAYFVRTSTPTTLEAYNLTVTGSKDSPIAFELAGYSPDNQTLTYRAAIPPNGNLTVVGANVTYTPNRGYLGPDNFTYTVADNHTESGSAKVNITITTAGDAGWAKSFGSTQDDEVVAMVSDTVGNLYVTGNFSGTVDFDPGPKNFLLTSAGKTDVFITKFGPDGSHAWTRAIGGAADDTATDIAIDATGNLYVTGTFSGTIVVDPKSGTSLACPSGTAGFIARFGPDGTFGWTRAFGAVIHSVAFSGLSDVYVGGAFSGQVDFDDTAAGKDQITSHGQLDGFVTKLGAGGEYRWTRAFGGSQNDEVMAVSADQAGNLIAAGYFNGTIDLNPDAAASDSYTSLGGTDIFLVQLNTMGQKIWAHTIGGLGNDQPTSLATDGFGNVALGGFFEQKVTFNSVTGADALTSAGDRDGFVSIYNSGGAYFWTRTVGGAGRDSVNAVTFGSSGEVYAAGFFTGTVNFKSGGTDSKTSAGQADAFVTQFTNGGVYGLTVTAGGNGADTANGVTVRNGQVYWGGAFQNTADLDPRPTSAENHVAFGADDGFLIKMTANGGWQ